MNSSQSYFYFSFRLGIPFRKIFLFTFPLIRFSVLFTVRNTVVFIGTLGLLSACGGGDNNGGGTNEPQTADEALEMLPPAVKSQFESWKARPVKSCEAEEILGSPGEAVGVDYNQLRKMSGGTQLFSLSPEQWVIFDGYSSFSGVSSTLKEQSSTVNGKTVSYSIKAERSGPSCEVSVFGQKVFETVLAQSVNIVAAWDSAKADQQITVPERPTLEESRGDLGTVVSSHSLIKTIREALAPTGSSRQMLAQVLKISQEASGSLFPLNHGRTLSTVSFRFVGETPSSWFSPNDSVITSDNPRLASIIESSRSQPAQMEMVVAVGSDDNDRHVPVGFTVELATQMVSMEPTGRLGQRLLFSSFALDPQFQLSPEEMGACFVERTRDLIAFESGEDEPENPYFYDIKRTCEVLSKNFKEDLLLTNSIGEALPLVLDADWPHPGSRGYGWSSFALEIASDLMEKGENPDRVVNPGGSSPTLSSMTKGMSTAQTALKSFPALKDLGIDLWKAAGHWGLMRYSVDASEMSLILSGLDNVIEPFRESTERLVKSDFFESWGHWRSRVRFAASVDAAYKTVAVKAKTAALAMDYEKWVTEVFDRVLQIELSEDRLTSDESRLSSIQRQLTSHTNLKDKFSALAAASMEVLANSELSSDQLSQKLYVPLSQLIDVSPDSVDSIIGTMGRSGYSAVIDDLAYAQTMTKEFKDHWVGAVLASQNLEVTKDWIERRRKALFREKPNLEQVKSWKTLMSEIVSFHSRELQRVQSGNDFLWDRYFEKIVDNALDNEWSVGSLKELEAITELAAFDNFCERHITASSKADCIGLARFTGKTKSGFFHSSHGGRYGVLAGVFKSHLSRISGDDIFFARDLYSGFFPSSRGVIWSACNEQQFQRKKQSFQDQMNQYHKSTNTFEKWDIKSAIEKTMKNC